MKIKVYDLGTFVEKETEGKYKIWGDKEFAVILNNDGAGVIMDNEAVGQAVDALDEEFYIPVMKASTTGVLLVPHGEVAFSIKQIINSASYRELELEPEPEAGGFFRRGRKDRLNCNYNDMLRRLKRCTII